MDVPLMAQRPVLDSVAVEWLTLTLIVTLCLTVTTNVPPMRIRLLLAFVAVEWPILTQTLMELPIAEMDVPTTATNSLLESVVVEWLMMTRILMAPSTVTKTVTLTLPRLSQELVAVEWLIQIRMAILLLTVMMAVPTIQIRLLPMLNLSILALATKSGVYCPMGPVTALIRALLLSTLITTLGLIARTFVQQTLTSNSPVFVVVEFLILTLITMALLTAETIAPSTPTRSLLESVAAQ
jgi:hypothetical protein